MMDSHIMCQLSGYDEFFHSHNNQTHSFEWCSLADDEIISAVSQAANSLDKEDYSFAFYELGLSQHEKNLLNQIDISVHNYDSIFNIFDMTKRIESFVKSISLNNTNNVIALDAASIISRIVHNIIDSSGFEHASVFMTSVLDTSILDNKRFDWHVDKTLEEVINPNCTSQAKQLIYLFTLRGEHTLYYQADYKFHEEFIKSTFSTRLSFGCYEDECKMMDAVDPSHLTSAEYGQGSVHAIGKDHGALHMAPIPHKRIIGIVVPAKQDVLESYLQALIKYSRP